MLLISTKIATHRTIVSTFFLLVKIDLNSLQTILLIAKNKYDKKVYSEWIKKISGDDTEDRIENLLYNK